MITSAHRAFLALLIAGMVTGPAFSATRDSEGPPTAASVTGKERLSDKASDEQRIDDCKVPVERRSRPRPTSCPAR
jgi:hypothetical protein